MVTSLGRYDVRIWLIWDPLHMLCISVLLGIQPSTWKALRGSKQLRHTMKSIRCKISIYINVLVAAEYIPGSSGQNRKLIPGTPRQQ